MKGLILLFLCFASLESMSQVAGNATYSNEAMGNAPRAAKGNSISNYNAYNNTSPSNNLPKAQLSGNTNEMQFEVNALFNAQATSYTAIFNVVQMGETAQNVDEFFNERLNRMTTELLKAGIPRENIVTDMLSFVPVYEMKVGEEKLFSKTFNEVPAGFELQKNIHIKYTKAEQLDKIVSAAAIAEIYDLVKVEYFVADSEKIFDTLRNKTVDFMNKKLESFKRMGIKTDSLYRVVADAQFVYYPTERYEKYQAFAGQSFEAVKSKKRSTVNAIRKPMSMYYNKIAYNQFDIILNPEFTEPPVQYVYNLKVRLLREPKAPKEASKYFYYITPAGDMRQLDVK